MSRKVTNKNRTRPTDIFADNILTDTQRCPYNPQTPSLCWNRCPGEPARRGLGQSSPCLFSPNSRAISGVGDGRRNRKNRKNRCDFGALSSEPKELNRQDIICSGMVRPRKVPPYHGSDTRTGSQNAPLFLYLFLVTQHCDLPYRV